MSASFIAVAFLAAVLLVNWRLVLLVIAACLVALVAFGIGIVTPESLRARCQATQCRSLRADQFVDWYARLRRKHAGSA